ncbi:Hypothetical predicted protein [Mytilus galloprovincialis]|uniref:Uncharacterized protein n=1 Tax=Mytilus galloprovincialis TaxID=29158 RepID=A0A8B6FGB6_MYTGA|nr:Hypothetical predicted protein [Mytilus galloprovincialis]
MNDKSLNKTKYYEELDESSQTSILTIKSFSVEDVNIPYECVYGFEKYGATLVLTTDGYEFHPKEKLPVKPAVSKGKIHLNVTFRYIYPVPVCSAMIGLNNISSELNVSSRRHDVLYMSTIALDYTTSSAECGDSLSVTCLVGQTGLTVTDCIPFSCNFRAAAHAEVLPLIAIGIAAVFLLIMVVFYIRRKKYKSNNNNEESLNLSTLTSKTKQECCYEAED